jgi:hypothetical protein
MSDSKKRNLNNKGKLASAASKQKMGDSKKGKDGSKCCLQAEDERGGEASIVYRVACQRRH